MNNVIRSLHHELTTNYGIGQVLGIRHGYQGLNPEIGLPPIELTREIVASIHHQGGTILGTSRGHQDPDVMLQFLTDQKIDILFCVGGDGTQRGAHAMATRGLENGLPIAIVGIPKTIDNDIKYCYRTFGFQTAVAEAEKVIDRANVEATSVIGGIGLVKLMGREAGFIAAAATLASGQVNFTLIPEVPFQLEGDNGLLAKLARRLESQRYAVVVVAEGAGQQLLDTDPELVDASGNRRLGDIGIFLKERIADYFKRHDRPCSLKYFDPSYHIRSCPANTTDSLLCEQLARNAAHAGMAGKTDLLVGIWNNRLVHVPLELSVGKRRVLSPESALWSAVQAMTGQDRN